MPPDVRHITIIQGHPDPRGGHFGHALGQAYAEGARAGGHPIEVIAVASLDFPLLRSREDQQGDPPPAIREAQAAISRADHLVLIYPVWNGAMPALVKGFLEQTFRPGFMFPDSRPGQTLGFVSALRQMKALKGKTARVVVTMQMPAFVYRWYFHPHPEKNTLRLSGVGPIRESLIGLVEAPSGRNRERWLSRMRVFGRDGR